MNQIVMPTNHLRPITAILLPMMLALGACGAEPSAPGSGEQRPLSEGALYGSTIGGPFELIGTDGQTVRDTDFAGKWRMVYFGYAYCPDVCPFDVARMIQGYDAFAEKNPALAADVVPIFISIDPERDTRDVIEQFTAQFSDKLVGLTGTPEQVAAAANEYSAYYEKGEVNDAGGYLMDHTNIGYLMDPDGEPVALLSVDESAASGRNGTGNVGPLRERFWELDLGALNRAEWEALCDGCGRCCLHKLEDDDTGEVIETNVACKLLDTGTAQCRDYRHRKAFVPDCLRLTLQIVRKVPWLPSTCAYRLPR